MSELSIVKPLSLALLVLVIALFVPMMLRALARQRRGDERWPFATQRPLTRPEQVLYFRLVEALPGRVVLAQVQLSRFLRVRKGQPWREWNDRIASRSIDFLVCERDFTIVAAIEVDDASLQRAERYASDPVKNRALAAAAIPLIRWRTTALPDIAAIRAAIDDAIDSVRGEPLAPLTAVASTGRVEPSFHATHVTASNDETMFSEETKT